VPKNGASVWSGKTRATAVGDKSKIQWTDATWNPIRARNLNTRKVGWHCEHVTPGCEHCYAESLNSRLGTGLPFKPGHRKDIEIFLDEETLTQPLRWKRPRMVFVCSMSDLFADFVSNEWLARIFNVMADTPQHTFQVLTKRAKRMHDVMNGPKHHHLWSPKLWHRSVLPNVWLGVSAEDQERFNERWPILRSTPAAIRFLSIEPQLGRVDMCKELGIWLRQINYQSDLPSLRWESVEPKPVRPDWVIVGGESGPHARPFQIEWALSLVSQCRAAGVSCFIKQLGANPVERGMMYNEEPIELRDKKGGDMAEWPSDLRVREMPA
jgi:protein gp37